MAWMVALLAPLAPAQAQVTAYAPGQGAVNSVSVNIEVRASVRHRCGFAEGGAPQGRIDQPDFDRTGFSQDIPIVLNCSGASRVAVSSEKGRLVADAGAVEGLASSAAYDVALRLVADNGSSASGSCSARSLTSTGGACAFAGNASGTNGLLLPASSTRANGSYLRVSAPAQPPATQLAAGRYSDRLTITVSVAP
jgi:hypothetical protein